MFYNIKLSIAAVSALLISSASALTLGVPVIKTSGATTTISWTSAPTDPSSWTLYLSKYNQIWAFYGYLATNVNPATGFISITLPAGLTPASDYAIKAVFNDNIDRVVAQSPQFAITA